MKNRKRLILSACMAWLGLGWAVEAAPTPGQVIFQNLCSACHGVKGEGNATVQAPAIAALPHWYVRTQLENFQQGKRGAHAEDVEGQMMRSIAMTLSVEQTRDVSTFVHSLTRTMAQPTFTVDTAAGKELYAERCMECHRFNGEGEFFFHSPPLIGLQDWYVLKQLRKFKTGIRGVDKEDVYGQKMVFNVRFIENEIVLKSLVAYLIELQNKAKNPADEVFGR